MNKAIIEQKETLVNEVSEELKNSASTVVVEYRGLTVAKIRFISSIVSTGYKAVINFDLSMTIVLSIMSLIFRISITK